MNLGGTWHADIRIQRKWSDDYGNIWTMPCSDTHPNNVAYDGGVY